MYNGHEKGHAIQFQSVATPNALVANLYGTVEDRRHDSTMLALSGLLPLLQQHARFPNGDILCIYGNPAYPLRRQLQAPFRRARINVEQILWNKAVSKVRISVEWLFGDIINYLKFLDFHKNLKFQLSAKEKKYLVCALLQNQGFYGSITSEYFGLEPPSVHEYFP